MECAVCMEGYYSTIAPGTEDRRPRLLACGHCACLGCLRDLCETPKDDSKAVVLCPFDRSETVLPAEGVEGLKINYALMEAVELLSQQGAQPPSIPSEAAKAPLCFECESVAAEIHCPSCDHDLCAACAQQVHSSRSFQSHKTSFVPLKDKPVKPKSLEVCPIHKDEQLKLWCQTDRVQVCLSCVAFGDHKGHTAHPIANSAQAERKELQEKLTRAAETEKFLLRSVLQANKVLDTANDSAKAHKLKVEQDAAALIKLVTDHKTAVIARIDATYNKKTKPAIEHSSDLAHCLNTLRASMGHVQAAISSSSSAVSIDVEKDLSLLREASALSDRLKSAGDRASQVSTEPAPLDPFEVKWHPNSSVKAQDGICLWSRSCCASIENSNLNYANAAEVKTPDNSGRSAPCPADCPHSHLTISPPTILPLPPTTFKLPQCVVVNNSTIIVSDFQGDCLYFFRLDGTFLRCIGSKGAGNNQFSNPSGIAFGDDSIFVQDTGNKRVCVLSADGTVFLRSWSVPCTSYGLVYAEGSLFITDYQQHCIHAYSPDGNLLRSFGSSAVDGGILSNPWGIAYWNQQLFVSNHIGCSVAVFNTNGQFVRSWGSPGTAPGQLSRPLGITVFKGLVLVSEHQSHCISVFFHEGAFVRRIKYQQSVDKQFSFPRGLCVTDHALFVVDDGNKRVCALDFSPN